jgi:DNA-binding transcriptional ArsR family regulator
MPPGDVDAVFFALSDPTRRDLMRHLSEEGPTTASELAERLPITRQAIAKHLAALEGAGLVASRTDGRRRSYRITPRPLTEAMDWMVLVGAEWDERLDALRGLLERRRRPSDA